MAFFNNLLSEWCQQVEKTACSAKGKSVVTTCSSVLFKLHKKACTIFHYTSTAPLHYTR
jgi:hypothetical protein